MSNSDDKKDSKTSAPKSPVTKPVKRSRKRQASRPPTINVKAVHLEGEAAGKATSENIKEDVTATKNKTTHKTGKANSDTKTGDEKPETVKSPQKKGQFGYRAVALAAGVGAAASIVLFAGVFGVKVFTSGQKGLEDRIAGLSGEVEALRSIASNAQIGRASCRERV